MASFYIMLPRSSKTSGFVAIGAETRTAPLRSSHSPTFTIMPLLGGNVSGDVRTYVKTLLAPKKNTAENLKVLQEAVSSQRKHTIACLLFYISSGCPRHREKTRTAGRQALISEIRPERFMRKRALCKNRTAPPPLGFIYLRKLFLKRTVANRSGTIQVVHGRASLGLGCPYRREDRGALGLLLMGPVSLLLPCDIGQYAVVRAKRVCEREYNRRITLLF